MLRAVGLSRHFGWGGGGFANEQADKTLFYIVKVTVAAHECDRRPQRSTKERDSFIINSERIL